MPLILVAGENRDSRLTLRQLLQHDDYRVVEADDGESCLGAAAQWQPDLAILGDLPPDTLDVCARLRASFVQLPILVILPDDPDTAERAFAVGASDIIRSPIHWTILRHRVSHLVDIGHYTQLLDRQDWYRSIIENALEGIYRSAPDGRFLMVNPALVKMLGYDSAKEVLALNPRLDVHVSPEQRERMIGQLEHEDVLESEAIWKTKSGELIVVNVSARAIRDTDGTLLHYEGQALNITERKMAEAALIQSRYELQAKTESLQTIQALADAVYDSLDVPTVIESALDAVLNYFHVSGVILYLVDEEAGCLRRAAARALPPAMMRLTETIPLEGTTSGLSVQTRNLVVSEALSGVSPEMQAELRAEEVTHVVAVPLLFRGNAIGSLSLPLHNNRTLTPQERETLLSAGKTIGLAIANAQYVERVEAEVQERLRAEQAEREHRVLAEALRDTAAALNSELNANRVLERIFIYLRRVIPYDTANIMLLENDMVQVARATGYGEKALNVQALFEKRYPLAEAVNLRWMAERGRGLAIADVREYEGWINNETTDWIRSHAGAPILVDGRVIGFLNLDSAEPNTFRREHAKILKIFADQAGTAIRNARLYEEARKQAEILEQRVAERTSELVIEKAKLQAILDGMADGVTAVTYGEPTRIENLWDIVPIYRYTNQVLYQMLGYTPEEGAIDWLRTHAMTVDQYHDWRTKMVQGLLATNFWQSDLPLRRKDGTEFDCGITVTGIRDDENNLIGAITIFRDISHERALERRKERFISNAAHELRTPITNLKTRLYLAGKQPHKMETHLQILEQVTDHMKNLVEYLLDLSRLERGAVSLQLETLDLDRFIADVAALQEPEADKHGLTLTIESSPTPLMVNADPGRINQVITNLLSNAIHHTPQGGAVTVSIEPGEGEAAGMACIRVCDTGVGIKPEHLPHIFQAFYQANQSGTGVGLGLSISKEIIDLHGGHIRVKSTPDEGTCFTVALPLSSSSQAQPPGHSENHNTV